MLAFPLVDYRCTACGRVEELELPREEAPEERWGFCECRADGMPVRMVRITSDEEA